MKVHISVGDIFEQDVDCIVNPAHPSLLAGSGLCGEVHQRAGKAALHASCQEQLTRLGLATLPIGMSVVTSAFALPFKHIIHTAVPKYYQHGADQLVECYASCFRLARSQEIRSLAVPALGIGVNQIPVELSAQALREAVNREQLVPDLMVVLIATQDEIADIFTQALHESSAKSPPSPVYPVRSISVGSE